MNDAQKAVKLLSQVQLDFIEVEVGVDKEAIEKMSDQKFSDLYDTICDIEVEETMKSEELYSQEDDEGE